MNRNILALLLCSLAAVAHAAPHGILWAHGAKPVHLSAATSGLQYYGGPVISNAKVYAVFWGDKVDSDVQANVGPFFANILDSTYIDWLSEYDTNRTAVDGRQGTAQHIGRGSFAGSITIHPAHGSKSLSDADVQKELDDQIAAGKLPPASDNNLYMVYFPSGVSIAIEGQRSCSAFCAYHEGFKSPRTGQSTFYGVMPTCGFGCGGSGMEGQSAVSSHECLEAITDPFPTPGDKPAYPQAWNDAGGQEIADLCQEGSGVVNGHGLSSTVSWEWDNSIGGCAKGPWSQNLTSVLSIASRALPPIPMLDGLRGVPAARVFAGN
jgi:hypothetical protein